MLPFPFKRLQKVQNATAGFVTGNFAKVNDVITLGWLPIKERIEFSLGKLAYNALKHDKWPGYHFRSKRPQEFGEVIRTVPENLNILASKTAFNIMLLKFLIVSQKI